MTKRKDYISWDDYFMGLALLSAKRSKDPSSQVGACIVDSRSNRILSVGYNGLPRFCSDDEYPWTREGDSMETKYFYVVHAELNAILNSRGANLEGSRLYTTLFPCNECAKAIIQSGIKQIVYLSDKYSDTDIVKASKRMLTSAGVEYYEFETEIDGLNLNFK
jgi:dCMP deaminase